MVITKTLLQFLLNANMVLTKKLFVNLLIFLYKGCVIAAAQSAESENSDESATPHTIPYMVAIIKDYDLNDRCGGALISENFILTAAQCVDGPAVTVILGANDISKNEREQKVYNISQTDIILHPHYIPHLMENDIALIKLPEKLDIGPYIQTVDLPDTDADLFIGESAVLTGWSQRLFLGYSDTLSEDEFIVISNERCNRFFHQINDKGLCAKINLWKIKPGCINDPGSPLVVRGETDILVGIVPAKSKICSVIFPAVFVRISSYRTWIDQEINMSANDEQKQTGLPTTNTTKEGNK